MLINFAEKSYGTSVVCHQVSADGYDVENLITLNANSKSFRVEYYIKPPIDIIFSFNKCKVDLKSLVLNTACSTHHVDTMEIYVSNNVNNQNLYDFINVAKCFLVKSPLLSFENPRYQNHQPNQNTIVKLNKDVPVHKLTFKNTSLLYNVGSLKIRILRMTESGVPGLKSIEIWGKPSTCTSPEVVKQLLSLNIKPSLKINDVISKKNPNEESKLVETTLKLDSVPEEFLDSITFNIMSFPILLPSGRSIDRSSLEELYKTGRQPFDPFTGLPFSNQRKPIPNNALKLRIDNYLTKGSINPQLKAIPRILGTDASSKYNEDSIRQSRLLNINEKKINSGNSENHKRPCERVDSSLKAKKLRKETDISSHCTHDEKLTYSLDEAIASVLTNSMGPKDLEKNNSCSFCKFSSPNSYFLPCKHIICRQCVIPLKFINSLEECLQCNKYFEKNQITAVHLNSLQI